MIVMTVCIQCDIFIKWVRKVKLLVAFANHLLISVTNSYRSSRKHCLLVKDQLDFLQVIFPKTYMDGTVKHRIGPLSNASEVHSGYIDIVSSVVTCTMFCD